MSIWEHLLTNARSGFLGAFGFVLLCGLAPYVMLGFFLGHLLFKKN